MRKIIKSKIWFFLFVLSMVLVNILSINYYDMKKEHDKAVEQMYVWKDIAYNSKDMITGNVKFGYHDLDLLARLIQSEAGNKDYKVKLMVGSVVMNRVASSTFPDSISGVVYQEGQFDVVTNGSINNPASEESQKAAEEVLTNGSVLPSRVMVFFSTDCSEPWVNSRPVYAEAGGLTFSFLN